MDKRKTSRRRWLLVTAILLTGASACVSVPTPTAERPGASPTDRPAVGDSRAVTFEVRREIPGVWAGASDPLPRLEDNDFHALQDGHRVTTDGSGEALLLGDLYGVACKVYLFQSSRLVKRACSRLSSATGNTSCLEEGSAVYNGCSGHLIMTPSGQILVRGSWISVTYLSSSRMTLVAVVEGEAAMQQVLTFETGELGEPVSLTGGQMLVSLPDVKDGMGIPAMPLTPLYPEPSLDPSELLRQPLPILLLPLAAELLQIQGWMQRVADRAEDDGVPFVTPAAVTPAVITPLPVTPVVEWPGGIPVVSEQDFEAVVLESDALMLVEFGAPGCAPCQETTPALEQAAWIYALELSVLRVDAENAPRLASRYGVSELPTLLFFKDGDVVDTMVGPQAMDVLMERIEGLLGGSVVAPGGIEPQPMVEPTREGTETAQVLVELEGGALEDGRVQYAVAFGVDWDAIASDLFTGQPSPLLLELEGTRINAQRFVLDAGEARKNLTEAGYPDGFDLVMEYLVGDEILARIAERVEAYLGEIGVGVIPTLLGQTFEEPGGEAPAVSLGEVLMGRPTLRLNWVSR